MGIKSFLKSDYHTKKHKFHKWLHRNDWEKKHSPSLFSRIRNEIYYNLHSKDCLVVDGWLVRFYESEDKYMNWGDDLNVYLLERMTNKKIIPLKTLLFRKFRCRYLVIGSVIPNCLHKKAIVWGAGVMDGKQKLSTPPKAILAVRGPLTRNYFIGKGIDCPEVYGDPALLLPIFYTPRNKNKKYKITIIPHHRDFDDEKLVTQLTHCKGIHVINMANYISWWDVVDEICQSEVVLSSSLHGLIVSDAYGVPNQFVEYCYHHPNYDKYKDYYLSVNERFIPPPVVQLSEFDVCELVTLAENVLRKYKRPNMNIEPLIKSCPFEILEMEL